MQRYNFHGNLLLKVAYKNYYIYNDVIYEILLLL
jgi:hypothetical protein